jgi:TBC1 domain family member 2B
LKDIIKLKLPDLNKHLESFEIDISSITLNWFVSIFIDSVPFDTLLRIWDCFLLEGSKVLLRVSLVYLNLL